MDKGLQAAVPFGDFTGMRYGYWQVGMPTPNEKYTCTCSECGHTRAIKHSVIEAGTAVRCRHEKNSRYKYDLTNQTIGEWFIIGRAPSRGDKKGTAWICRCSCQAIREVNQAALLGGRSKNCGHDKAKAFIDIKGKQFNDWHVLGYNASTHKWLCECTCGTRRELTGYQLRAGTSKSCGHSTTALLDLTGKKFGEWYVAGRSKTKKEKLGGLWTCICSCGTVRDISSAVLRNGASKSCGCKSEELKRESCLEKYGVNFVAQAGTSRTQEQLDRVETKGSLVAAIKNNFNDKPTTLELARLLGLTRSATMYFIHRYDIDDIVAVGTKRVSSYELELNELFPCSHGSDRGILGGKELDLYYPEKQFAIEFNGNWWHSELKKSETYHQEKTLATSKLGIQLLHIYEYEWNDGSTQRKIVDLIIRKLKPEILEHIQAEKCAVKEISELQSTEFLDTHHIQKSAQASLHLGLYSGSKLVGVMTFRKAKCNTERAYELMRMGWAEGIAVHGGYKKLFNYFTSTYAPSLIMAYCDIGKFSGEEYKELGFKAIKLRRPKYIWVDVETNKVITRGQATKQRLTEADTDTENDIMHRRGYLKVYDSGSLQFAWTIPTERRLTNNG